MRNATVGFALAALLLAPVASAQSPEQTLAGVAGTIRPGEKLRVTVSDGTELSGRLRSLTPAAIELETRDGVLSLAAERVRRIVVKDSVRNGLLVGVAAGGGAGLIGGLAVNAICRNESGACPATVLLLTAAGAAGGAAIGAGLDGLIHPTPFNLIPGAPREFAPEIVGSAGFGFSRTRGINFRGPASVGGGWSMRHRSGFGFTLDATRTIGHVTRTVPCEDAPREGTVGGPCTGEGRQGVEDTTTATAKAQYYFLRGRVQPYASAGAAVYQDSLLSVVTIGYPWRPPSAMQRFERQKGVALVTGGGARVRLTPRLMLRPDATFYTSRHWTHVRVSVGIGAGW